MEAMVKRRSTVWLAGLGALLLAAAGCDVPPEPQEAPPQQAQVQQPGASPDGGVYVAQQAFASNPAVPIAQSNPGIRQIGGTGSSFTPAECAAYLNVCLSTAAEVCVSSAGTPGGSALCEAFILNCYFLYFTCLATPQM